MSTHESRISEGAPAAPSFLGGIFGAAGPGGPHQHATLGILLLIAGLFAFTLMDAAAKHLTGNYHPAQIIWARFAINLALVMMLFRGRVLPLLRTRAPKMQLSRGLLQMATITLYFIALREMGLAEAAVLFDINPILITLGAALFLGEHIGPRRIAGIVIAFIGALIVLRPGIGAFDPMGLVVLGSAASYAASNLLTRRVREDMLVTSILWSVTVGTVMTSLYLPFVWKEVSFADMPLFLAVGVLGAIGQTLVIRAFSVAEAGALAPIGYFGLIFAGLWGWLFFDQLPDIWTFVGALVIVGAGLYVWHRERKAT